MKIVSLDFLRADTKTRRPINNGNVTSNSSNSSFSFCLSFFILRNTTTFLQIFFFSIRLSFVSPISLLFIMRERKVARAFLTLFIVFFFACFVFFQIYGLLNALDVIRKKKNEAKYGEHSISENSFSKLTKTFLGIREFFCRIGLR